MRGVYEQHWQEALAGARIEPSAAIWENIAGRLDTEQGPKGWVTLLLIAATISIAFAFPLTIGNSSFDARPDAYRYIGRSAPGTGVSVNSQDSGITRQAAHANQKDAGGATRPAEATMATVVYPGSQDNMPEMLPRGGKVEVKPLGLAALGLATDQPLADINDYYLLPVYMPAARPDRKIMAAANFGAGSLTNSNNINSFGVMETADMAFDLTDGLRVASDARQEDPGTTYYVGGGVDLPLGNKWTVFAGLGFLSQQANGTSNLVFDVGKGYQPLAAYDPVVSGTVFLSESYTYTVTNNYLNLPVVFKYPLVDKKIKLRAGIGLSTDIMLAHIVSTDTYGKSNYRPSSMGYNPVVMAGLVNLDVSYGLTENYAMAFETGWRKGFSAVDETKKYYPSSFTMGLVLFYQIR